LGAEVPIAVLSEHFDSVTAPILPGGWTSSTAAGRTAWTTSTNEAATPPNSAFTADAGSVSDNSLSSPSVFIESTNARLTFRHYFSVEGGYDGGVLEIALGNAVFSDIIAAGGAFVTNGYNGVLSTYYGNPLAGRSAWTGDSGGFITTIVTLPPSAAGQNARLRWRLGTDTSYGFTGWYVDDVVLSEPAYACHESVMLPLLFNVHSIDPSNMAFSFNTLSGQTYYIETATNLGPSDWRTMNTNAGLGTRASFTNSILDYPVSFFRVRVR
jgi:hypothetical protein